MADDTVLRQYNIMRGGGVMVLLCTHVLYNTVTTWAVPTTTTTHTTLPDNNTKLQLVKVVDIMSTWTMSPMKMVSGLATR